MKSKTADTDGTIIEFMQGSHSYDGIWFGEPHPILKGQFWWRTILREYLSSGKFHHPVPDEAGEVYVWVSKITEIDKANFWSKAKQMGYCWEWQNNKDSNGYGMVKIQGLYTKASRVAYQIINGAILDGLHVLHKCDNPGCINPDHLFTGTHQDNMNDKTRKGRGKTLGKGSKYMGVVFRSDSKKWRAYISQNGKHIRLGCFATEEEAAKRRDEEVIKLNLNLKLNF